MFVFLGFFTVASLSLMNSIIGVVVESTLASARANADKESKVAWQFRSLRPSAVGKKDIKYLSG